MVEDEINYIIKLYAGEIGIVLNSETDSVQNENGMGELIKI